MLGGFTEMLSRVASRTASPTFSGLPDAESSTAAMYSVE